MRLKDGISVLAVPTGSINAPIGSIRNKSTCDATKRRIFYMDPGYYTTRYEMDSLMKKMDLNYAQESQTKEGQWDATGFFADSGWTSYTPNGDYSPGLAGAIVDGYPPCDSEMRIIY